MRSRRQQPKDFLPLKPNWFYVMLSLAHKDQHGYRIMQDILERTSGKVRLWPASLYGTLKRLMKEGLLMECHARPASERDDPRRRYYRLTNFGRSVLQAETERLDELFRVIRANKKSKSPPK